MARNLGFDAVMSLADGILVGRSRGGDEWRVCDRTFVVKEYGWFERGGGSGAGAIDFIMTLYGCDADGAIKVLLPALRDGFAPEVVDDGTSRRSAPRTAEIPAADGNCWPRARNYLIVKRKLDAALVDALHEQGLIYGVPVHKADGQLVPNLVNLVFMSSISAHPGAVACEIRGAGDPPAGSGKKAFKSKRGRDAWFSISGDGGMVALVESAIEALSLRQIGFKGRIVSSGGAIGAGSALIELIKDMGWELMVAVNNDGELDDLPGKGGGFFKSIRKAVPGASRMIPRLKDWNDQLKAGIRGCGMIVGR